MYDLSKFGKRLKKRRQDLALTQQKLSDISGVNVSSIRHYESYGELPSALNAICLAEALRIKVSYLLGEDYIC